MNMRYNSFQRMERRPSCRLDRSRNTESGRQQCRPSGWGRGRRIRSKRAGAFHSLLLVVCSLVPGFGAETNELSLKRDGHWLSIFGDQIPGEEVRINYLEAYCRAGSTAADWVKHTVVPHESELLSGDEGRVIKIKDVVQDGLVVEHTITAGVDEVTFEIVAHNPTDKRSEAHWAQPCIRLADFTGFRPGNGLGDIEDYLPKCFVFLDGKLTRMPTPVWAKEARYVPGQVWAPEGVPRTDVNPRPLNPQITSNGLIGCFSADEKMIFAVAFEPYQELFQGVIRCLHSDFRLGGVEAGGTLTIKGKIYIVENDVPKLLERYRRDFPEHER